MAEGCCKCCQLPNGALVMAPAILSILGTLFSIGSIASCRWFVITDSAPSSPTRKTGYGFTIREFTNLEDENTASYCRVYGYSLWEKIDTFHIVGMYLNGVACFFGFVLTIAVWVGCCRRYRKCGWKLLGTCYFINFLLQGTSLMFFATDVCRAAGSGTMDQGESCSPGYGAIFDMVAAALWVPCAMGCSAMPTTEDQLNTSKKEESDEENQGGSPCLTHVLVTETILADGTKRIKKTTTHPDGKVETEVFSDEQYAIEGGMTNNESEQKKPLEPMDTSAGEEPDGDYDPALSKTSTNSNIKDGNLDAESSMVNDEEESKVEISAIEQSLTDSEANHGPKFDSTVIDQSETDLETNLNLQNDATTIEQSKTDAKESIGSHIASATTEEQMITDSEPIHGSKSSVEVGICQDQSVTQPNTQLE